MFNDPSTAKGRMETGPQLRVSSDRLEEPWVQGEWFIYYTTPAPSHIGVVWEGVSLSAAGGLPDWRDGNGNLNGVFGGIGATEYDFLTVSFDAFFGHVVTHLAI